MYHKNLKIGSAQINTVIVLNWKSFILQCSMFPKYPVVMADSIEHDEETYL